jgi:alkyl sulfatase BDS1-like metallo-beta-lactamase superfamily hydrolase
MVLRERPAISLRRDMLSSLKQTLATAPDQVSDRVAKLVGGVPDERLEQFMRTPLRGVVLRTIFSQMPRRLDRQRATGINATVLWRITGRPDGGADLFRVVLADGELRVLRGDGKAAPVTITIDGADFLRVATGSTDPMQAYMSGKLSMTGDVMHAATITSLLRRPGENGERA